jgi:hypothetical protein
VVELAGAIFGAGFGMWHYYNPKGTLGAWFVATPGWELNAFGSFGAMSGFALASLALVASLSGHERAQEVIDSNPGRYLLRMLIGSTWAWFIAALACLIALAVGGVWTRVVVIALTSIACARAVLALIALYLFFKRYTVQKPTR